MTGLIHSVESFGASDGPGIRFIVFMQGCTMRCKYCHNPDTWCLTGGERMTASQVMQLALRYRYYWGESGGITVSGGEPMLQNGFVTELFLLAKQKGVSTVLDTSGAPFKNDGTFDKLFEVTDRVLLDIKHIDNEKHKQLTGRGNANILQFARVLDKRKIPIWIRHVLVPGLESDEDLLNLRAFIDTLSNVEKVEVLPYHTLGVHKWESLGLDYPLKDVDTPTAEYTDYAKGILNK